MRFCSHAFLVALISLAASCGTRGGDVSVTPESSVAITTTTGPASAAAIADPDVGPSNADFPAAIDLPRPRFGALGLALVDGYALPIIEATAAGWRALSPCGVVVDVGSAVPTVGDALVVLDPAHGGPDDKGVVLGGVTESAITLAVAEATADRLRQLGVPTVLTRAADVAVPIDFRREVVGASGAVVVLSIQLGRGPDDGQVVAVPSPDPSIRVRTDHRESARFGGIVHLELESRVPVEGLEWTQAAESGVYSVLNQRGGEFDSILRVDDFGVAGAVVELSVFDDVTVQALSDPDTQARFGEGLAAAIVRQLTTQDRGTSLGISADPVREAPAAGGPCVDPFTAAG